MTLADRHDIHFFWGDQPMSWMRYMSLYSFRLLNPEWDIHLWQCSTPVRGKYWTCPNQQDFFRYSGDDYRSFLPELDVRFHAWSHWRINELGPSHLSNLFKWQLMAGEGGWYADLDILWVRPMSHYLSRIDAGYNMAICYRLGYFSIGLLASTGGMAFFRRVLESAENATREVYQSAGVMAIYNALGCQPFQGSDHIKKIKQQHTGASILNFPMDLIYPWRCTEMADVFCRRHKHIPGKTIGIHWYAGAEISQQYNRCMNHNNFHQFDNTYSYFAQLVCGDSVV